MELSTQNPIKLLTEEERQPLREIYHTVFDSELPKASQANIAAYSNLEAFVTVEHLLRVGMIYSAGDTGRHIRELTRFLLDTIPSGNSVITIASEERQKKLFKRLGMREIDGTVYRLDL